MLIRTVVFVVSLALLAAGILGFFSHDGMLLGFFAVDMKHNVIHLVSGLLGLMAFSRGRRWSVGFASIFGTLYALLGVVGLIMAHNGPALYGIAMNMADHFLHIGIGAILLWVSCACCKSRA